MKKQEQYFALTLIISVLLVYVFALLGCAPTKVKIYPKASLDFLKRKTLTSFCCCYKKQL